MGDGCLSTFVSGGNRNYIIRIDGHKRNDHHYFTNVLVPLIERLFKKKTRIKYRKNYNIVFLCFGSKEIFTFLHSTGFPIGKKGNITIPDKLLAFGWNYVKHIIKGFADTDGCIYFTKNNKDMHYYPAIDIRSKSDALLKQMHEALKSHGFSPYFRPTHLILYGKQNLHKWMNEIGFSNINHLSKILYYHTYNQCPPTSELEFNDRINLWARSSAVSDSTA